MRRAAVLAMGVGALFLVSTSAFAEDQPAAQPPAPTPAADGTVQVKVESSKPVVLEKRDAEGLAWQFACNSPCEGTPLAVGSQYRVTGDGLKPSKPFQIDGSKPQPIVLKVNPATEKQYKVGMGVAIGGGVLFVSGVLVAAIGGAVSDDPQPDGTVPRGFADAMFAGSALMLAGVIAGIYGGATLLDNANSKVRGGVQHAPPARGQAPGANVALRQPTFVAPVQQQPTGPAISIPLLRGTF